MTSTRVDTRRTDPRHHVRGPVLIAMMVYSLGFVGVAAILWHESPRGQSAGLPAYAVSSRTASP